MSADDDLTEDLINRFQTASEAVDEFIKEYETPPELKDDILDAPMQF